MSSKNEILSGWGNIPKSKSHTIDASSKSDLKDSFMEQALIARGLGRSYADQATNNNRSVIKTEKLDKVIAFDDISGVLTCESGLSIDKIIQLYTPKGWFPMVTPGTKYITIGGAIANDIHGKAHHVDGTFANCVNSFTILLANEQIVTASREENSDLFWANFGGLGLFGIILTATLRLRKIESSYFKQKIIVANNLDEMLNAIDNNSEEYTSSVAWIDSMAKGDNLGRGVLTLGNVATVEDLPAKLKSNPLKIGKKPLLAVPFYMPNFTLNKWTVSILNRILFILQKNGKTLAHYEKFFYPLDGIKNWNRGYGRRGFIQYQFVLPLNEGDKNIKTLLKMIVASGCVPFLNVLKKFGGAGKGPLSFPKEGYTFAIDFPITKKLKKFTKELDQNVLQMGGRIYLGKDAYLDESTFKAMYPQFQDWLEIKQKYDPTNKFSSDLSRRIGLC